MSITTHKHSFLVVAEPDDVLELLEKGFLDFLKSVPYIRVVDITEKGVIIDLSIRRGFSRFRDRLIITYKRSEDSLLEVYGIGKEVEYTIIINVKKEFPHSRVEIISTSRSIRPRIIKAFLSDFNKRLEEYIKREIKLRKAAPAQAKPAVSPPSKKATAEAKPAEKPLVVEEKPKPAAGKPVVKEKAMEKPASLGISGRVLEEKMKDPLWIAQLLLSSSLIKRGEIQLPGSPKELIDKLLMENKDKITGYRLVMISLRGGDIDSHIIIDPVNNDILAAKTTKGGILDYTGEEAIKKLFEKKQEKLEYKLWGINQLPQQ